jgi:polyisoprenoid-binding protein YceI
MKSRILLVCLVVALGAACHSEVDEKPAAEVSATTATSDASATQPAAGMVTSSVIKDKSSIDFVAAKVTRDHKGKLNDFDGSIDYAGGQPTGVAFTIDLNSVETDEADLTKHLKTADFLDVATYPKATFTSSSLTPAAAGAANGATHELRGVLDLHGVKKEVAFPVKAEVTADGVRTTSEFTINRHDWKISYKGAADDLIKDNVLIKLNLMFPPPPAV